MIKNIRIRIRLFIRHCLNWLDKRHDALEIILLAVTICIAFVLYYQTKEQVRISKKAFEQQRITDSSNSVDQRIAIQPFLYVDSIGSVEHLVSNRFPLVNYRIKNSGMTPAYNILPKSGFLWESDYQRGILSDTTLRDIDTVGYILGRDNTMSLHVWWGELKSVWTKKDSIAFKKKEKVLLFFSMIVYEDAVGQKHFTQQGFIQSRDQTSFIELRKYIRTDHNEKNKTTTKAH